MLTRIASVLVAGSVAAALAFALSSSVSAEPSVSLQPTSGQAGSQVTANLSGFPPNIGVIVVFRSAGNPQVASGTTDASGKATLTFTVPAVTSGTYTVFVTDVAGECDVVVTFTVVAGQATPTPTVTNTPTATPTRTPTPAVSATPVSTATPVATPTATSTPTKAAPTAVVAGTGGVDGSHGSPAAAGPEMAFIAGWLTMFAVGFALFARGRKRDTWWG